ncbi:MAG: hypothetical protein QM775_20685 [Pirellulales bacterium]
MRKLCVQVLIATTALGCNSGKAPSGSTGGSPAGSGNSTAPVPVEVEDDAKSRQFRSTPINRILGDNFESRPDEFLEARIWLKDDKNQPAKLEQAAVAKLVEELYQAGAEKVYATGLKPNDKGGTTSDAIIALVSAADDGPRHRVLEVRNRHYAAYLPTVGKADLVESLSRTEVGLSAVVVELKH